jgi:1-aminocyclopropane-1-carboxylate deaminase/D-cysteine desulfhydrase-like pyridoxal-dependent ACC family enzyme
MVLSIEELSSRVEGQPRVHLGHFPTPLEPLPARGPWAEGPRIWVKRDDCTGLALGGNKTRHNEFILGAALKQGVDRVVWGASLQSNNCRQTAAACAQLGIPIHLLLTRSHPIGDASADGAPQGNLLLDNLLGATIEVVDEPLGAPLNRRIRERADQYRRGGERVLSADDPEIRVRAAVSYIAAAAELTEQLKERSLRPAALYVSSSGATGAGLVAGFKLLGQALAVRVVAPIVWPWDMRTDMAQLASQAASVLGLQLQVDPQEIDLVTDFVGPGYGVPSEEAWAALEMVARFTGILLDPVYTAKAFAALLDDIRQGAYQPSEEIVFLHTGGTPVLFAFSRTLANRFARTG